MFNRLILWACSGLILAFATINFSIQPVNAQINPASPIRPPLDINSNPPLSVSVLETPCSEFLKPYFDWAKRSSDFLVSTSVAFNNVEGRLVTYSRGNLYFRENKLGGNLTKLFSNEFLTLPAPSGSLGSNEQQPFSHKKTALVNITITPNGEVTWVERSFNNKTYRYKAVCYTNDTAILLPSAISEKSAAVMTFEQGRDPRLN